MAYGMTYRQFWDGPTDAHKAYKKAHKLVMQEQNTLAWIQGRYVYDAMYAMVPVLRAFSKARKPEDYVSEPYNIYSEQTKVNEEDEERIRYERIREKVALFAEEFNRKRHEKEAQSNSDDSSDAEVLSKLDGEEGNDDNSTGD